MKWTEKRTKNREKNRLCRSIFMFFYHFCFRFSASRSNKKKLKRSTLPHHAHHSTYLWGQFIKNLFINYLIFVFSSRHRVRPASINVALNNDNVMPRGLPCVCTFTCPTCPSWLTATDISFTWIRRVDCFLVTKMPPATNLP